MRMRYQAVPARENKCLQEKRVKPGRQGFSIDQTVKYSNKGTFINYLLRSTHRQTGFPPKRPAHEDE